MCFAHSFIRDYIAIKQYKNIKKCKKKFVLKIVRVINSMTLNWKILILIIFQF